MKMLTWEESRARREKEMNSRHPLESCHGCTVHQPRLPHQVEEGLGVGGALGLQSLQVGHRGDDAPDQGRGDFLHIIVIDAGPPSQGADLWPARHGWSRVGRAASRPIHPPVGS